MTPFPRVIIGVDPGLAFTGYGIIAAAGSRLQCLDFGVIQTQAEQAPADRLLAIFTSLTQVVSRYQPHAAAIETLYFAKNVTSGLGVSEARGICLLTFAQAGIPIGQYAPNAIKKTVTGIAQADKAQVQRAVQLLLGLRTVPKPDHAADALAAAITYVHNGAVRALP